MLMSRVVEDGFQGQECIPFVVNATVQQSDAPRARRGRLSAPDAAAFEQRQPLGSLCLCLLRAGRGDSSRGG